MDIGNRIKTTVFLTLAGILMLFPPSSAYAEEIVVSAAASLSDVLREMSKAYQTTSQQKVVLTLGPSNLLARQIDQGAPADIFFSADTAQMDFLDRNKRLEPGTRKNLLSNQLVVIVPTGSNISIETPKDLLKPEVRKIALADPSSVPAGIYASKYLAEEGLWNKMKSKIVPVLDVRATLASVEAGNVEAGFVYKTDAATSTRVKTVYEVPMDKGPKILYPVAIVRDSKKKDRARDFMNFLLSSAARAIFKKFGFLVLD